MRDQSGDSKEYETVRLDVDGRIARVRMTRPEAANAQGLQMTYDLNRAFDAAARDARVKVIILSGEGRHFSAGHDVNDTETTPAEGGHPIVGTSWAFDAPAAEGWMAREEEIYLNMCRRWRDIPKPTIAMVHGKCIAGGLALAWVCDLIVASADAEFSDPVIGMGANGIEWFVHTWELGSRKAKEMLFTAAYWSAQEAHSWGMVNQIVPAKELESYTLSLAKKIAEQDSFALKLVKESVNQSLDLQGQRNAVQNAFGLQQLAHAQFRETRGSIVPPDWMDARRRKDN